MEYDQNKQKRQDLALEDFGYHYPIIFTRGGK